MSTTYKLTGKAASWTFAGTAIPFTSISPSVDRGIADATDSTDYDPSTDMLWESQLPVKMAKTLDVEGRYNKNVIPSAVLSALFSGVVAQTVTIKLDASTTFGHGYFDITNFKASVPVNDMVTYTCTLKLNGVWVSGS